MRTGKVITIVFLVICFFLIYSLPGGQVPAGEVEWLEQIGLDQPEEYDLEGETVTLLSWRAARQETYFEETPMVRGRVEEAEERFNCEIDFLQVSTAEIPELNISRLMAGESDYDLWDTAINIGYFELVSDGAAYPMSDLLPPQFYESLVPRDRGNITGLAFHGRKYGVGFMGIKGEGQFNPAIRLAAYNRDLIDREGLPDIFELYRDYEWSWDKAEEIANQATGDTTGDGDIDQWGISQVLPRALALSNNTVVTDLDEEGRMVFTATEEPFLETLEKVHEWQEIQGVVGGNFENGTAAIDLYRPVFQLPGTVEEMEDDWVLIPHPIGPRHNDYVFFTGAMQTSLVPANAEKPEALVALHHFLWQPDDLETSDFLATHTQNQESAEVLLRAHEEYEGDIERLLHILLDPYYQAEGEVIRGEKSAAAAMEEIRPVIQAKIDELFDQ